MGLETSPRHISHEQAPVSTLRVRASFLAMLALIRAGIEPMVASSAEIQNPEFETIIETQTPLESETRIHLQDGSTIVIPPLTTHIDSQTIYKPAGTDPVRVVILIKQKHTLDSQQISHSAIDTSPAGLRRELDSVIHNQRQQYEILSELVDNGVVSVVCSEGLVTQETIESIESELQQDLPGRTAETIAPYLVEHRHFQMTADDLLKYKYANGGDLLIASEGRITLCPAETHATYNALWSEDFQNLLNMPSEYLNPADVYRISQIITEDREDAALSQVVAQQQPAVALTYGGGHDFKDALARWNKNHPALPLGMVVLSPNKSQLLTQ
jgi:hypothetical protein